LALPQAEHTREHSNTSVPSLRTGVHILQGSEDILLVDTELASLLESAGEHVEERLTVRVGVYVAMGLVVEVAAELLGIDQVSVLGQC